MFKSFPCLFVILVIVGAIVVLRIVTVILQRQISGGRPWNPGAGRRIRRARWRRLPRARGPVRGGGEAPPQQDEPGPSGPPVDLWPVCSNESCRHANRPEARYCSRCGTPLS